jgi:signal transduction histidine kinase
MQIQEPTNNKPSSISIILVIGFATLIILIITSGIISAYQVSLIRSSVTNMEQNYINQLNTLFKIREIISQIYFEARETVRIHRVDPSTKQFTSLPPNLKSELEKQLQVIENSSVGTTPEWKKFNKSLEEFINTSINPLYFQLNGFTLQTATFSDLDEVVKKIRLERTKITDQSNELQLQAGQHITITTAISLLAGLLVAGLVVMEIQKRLRQLQLSFRTINQAREFNRNIINGVVNALFTLDVTGNISSANQAFYSLLNLNIDCLGRHYQESLKNEIDLCKVIDQAYKENSTNLKYCNRINLTPNNNLLRIDVYLTTLSINNKAEGFIIVLVDVTEMESAQQERTRNQALAAIGQIAAQVAHELKNPLGGIKLNLSYLERKAPENDDTKEVISEIQTGIDRLNKTVLELSNFVRPKELNLSSTDINLLIEEQVSLIKDKINQKNIKIQYQFQQNLPAILVDYHELSKAFINFLINAVDASEESGEINILTKSEENKIIINFIDFGLGMSRETLARIFEPFFTTKSSGTGLGMSIAKRVIEMHKGKILVNSKPKEGSQIIVELPLTS